MDATATSWNPNPGVAGGTVIHSLVLSGPILYVGGRFETIGGQSRRNFAAIETSTGNATSLDINILAFDDSNFAIIGVTALALSDTILYVGGDSWSVGKSYARNRLAAINPATNEATSFDPNINGNGTVYSLVLNSDGSTLYAGGDFTTIGGQTRKALAALNTSDGTATSFDPNATFDLNATGTPMTLLLSGTTLYAGGTFNSIGGQTRNHLAALNVSDGTATSWNPNANNTVNTLALAGSTLYAGGDFTTIGGQTRNRIAALNTADGTASSWNPNASSTVRTLTISGTTLYAGGDFTSIGGQSRNYIAALNTSDGMASSWNPNANNAAYALALDGTTLYAGGQFTTIGGVSRDRLAALNADDSTATSWDPDPEFGDFVSSLILAGSTLYAGGGFYGSLGGVKARAHFAQFGTNPVPTTTSISPSSGTAGDSDTTITVTAAPSTSRFSILPRPAALQEPKLL
ncbi:MAG: Fibronectin type III domain protein [Parcubacteria group bacterium GW2011_GWA2_47_26]|nr:MAG: Fibronectin type III domain protein [Parcubacteria group bacterium GW2011_GWA2_47_26]